MDERRLREVEAIIHGTHMRTETHRAAEELVDAFKGMQADYLSTLSRLIIKQTEIDNLAKQLEGRKESNRRYQQQVNERQIALDVMKIEKDALVLLADQQKVTIEQQRIATRRLYSQNSRLLKSIEDMGTDA